MGQYLEESLKNQLTDLFKKLDQPVILKMYQSDHADQDELHSMLIDLTETSVNIRLELKNEKKNAPTVTIAIEKNSKTHPVGITFQGVPGGHEFSSLVLAILNAAGKGKLPDSGMIERIQKIKNPALISTYVSLSCENCPDVVQALNLIASIHPEIQHTMIEGGTAQAELESLGIQGVPSVVLNGKIIHSGKSNLLELVQKLENNLGSKQSADQLTSKPIKTYDVAVVGGGPAGVSAAIYSSRKGLNTVLITDRMGGQLQETKGIENMISVPYIEGPKLAEELAQHLKQYPIEVLEYRRVQKILEPTSPLKKLILESGESLLASTVIIATGAKWRELGIPGEKENIGQGVAFCAHCDGPFYKGKKVVVVGGGNSGVEAALDLSGIAAHVTLLEFNNELRADQILVQKLNQTVNAKTIVNAKTKKISSEKNKVTALIYTDNVTKEENTLDTDGVFVQIGLVPNSQFLKGTVELSPHGEVLVDSKGRTSVPGIYACGDVTPIPYKQIVTALGDGAKVALAAFEDRMHTK